MLNAKQRRSVVRVLIKAYYLNRDRSMLEVCRAEKIKVVIDRKETLGGHAGNGYVQIPGKCPKLYKEHVFWHEFCHIRAEQFHFYSRLIGYQGDQQQYDPDGGYWFWERLCEAFADLMTLYRCLNYAPAKVEEFLFEDSSSIGYAEAARFSMRRIETHCDKAVGAGRNIDLSDLKALIKQQVRFIDQAAHQPRFAETLYEHHQTPWPRFVNEREDSLTNQRHWGKKSWRDRHPVEHQVHVEIESLTAFHAQQVLFEDIAEANRKTFERRLARLDRFVKRYQQR